MQHKYSTQRSAQGLFTVTLRIIDVKEVYLVIVSHICSFASPVISFEFPSPHSLEIKKYTYKELQHYCQKN